MKQPDLISFSCISAGHAIDVFNCARKLELHAAYLPHGGMSQKHYTAVDHIVWVLGTPAQLKQFKEEFKDVQISEPES